MYQTLFVIPKQFAGIDVFGFGWLLGLWVLGAGGVVAWTFRRTGWSGETRSQLGMAAVVGLLIAYILPALVDEQLGGVAIRGYGTMLLLAVAAGVGLSMYRARRVGLDPEVILSLGTWFFVSGLVGARLFYIIEYWQKFQKPTLGETLAAMLKLTQGGLVVYGSLLAGGAALILFVYKNKLPGLALADLIAPGVILGVGLGRLGCFMNGCCYGGLSDLPWAVEFPRETPAYIDQIERGALPIQGLVFAGSGGDAPVLHAVLPDTPAARSGLQAGQRVTAVNGQPVASVFEAQSRLLGLWGEGRKIDISVADNPDPHRWTIAGPPPRSLPVHPTQLYSLFDAVFLCLVLLAYEPYKRRDGELAALLLTLHPISRFLLEIIRVDEGAVFGTGMSISQNISIGIFIGGLVLWAYILWIKPRAIAWRPLEQPNVPGSGSGHRLSTAAG